jgi:hypothetical protein
MHFRYTLFKIKANSCTNVETVLNVSSPCSVGNSFSTCAEDVVYTHPAGVLLLEDTVSAYFMSRLTLPQTVVFNHFIDL